MKTTVDLPEELLQKAMKITHAQTKTKAIITALEKFIETSKISEIKKYKGKIDMDIDMDTIRGRKCRF